MLKTKFTPLNREQFALLRESKRLVAAEFKKDLSLQDKDILDQIYAYALNSENERLFEIFNALYSSSSDDNPETSSDKNEGNVVKGGWKSAKTQDDSAVKIGDSKDGKVCTGFCRGQPVYK